MTDEQKTWMDTQFLGLNLSSRAMHTALTTGDMATIRDLLQKCEITVRKLKEFVDASAN